MRNRLVLLVFTAAALTAAMPAWGLGFGDLEVKSALGQPLVAEIQVLAVSPDERESLEIHLASPEIYERFGVYRSPTVSKLQLRILPGARDGRLRVLLTSREPIREPFLTVLLVARWAGNRVLREYTLLLDPPSRTPDTAAARAPDNIRKGSIEGAAGQRRLVQTRASKPPASAGSVRRRPDYNASPGDAVSTGAPVRRYGPVSPDDTLWSIAQKTRPAPGITMNQMMLAIFRANPEDFDGNINRLQQGATLQIPAPDRIRRIDPAVAASEIDAQMAAFANATPAPEAGPASSQQIATRGTATTGGQRPVAQADDAASDQPSGAQATAKAGAGASDSGGRPAPGAAPAEKTAAGGNSDTGIVASNAQPADGGSGTAEQSMRAGAKAPAGQPQDVAGPTNEQSGVAADTATGAATRAKTTKPGQGSVSAEDVQGNTAAGKGPPETPTNKEVAQTKSANVTANQPQDRASAGRVESKPGSQGSAGSGESLLEAGLSWLTPRRLILTLVIVVLILGVVRVYRRRQYKPVPADFSGLNLDGTAEDQETEGTETPAGGPVAAQEYSVDDVLADADGLSEHAGYDDALATLSLGLAAHPEDPRLLRKRLQVHRRAGDRDAFVTEARRQYPSPAADDPHWQEVAAWGRELDPDEPFFVGAESSRPRGENHGELGQALTDLEALADSENERDSTAPADEHGRQGAGSETGGPDTAGPELEIGGEYGDSRTVVPESAASLDPGQFGLAESDAPMLDSDEADSSASQPDLAAFDPDALNLTDENDAEAGAPGTRDQESGSDEAASGEAAEPNLAQLLGDIDAGDAAGATATAESGADESSPAPPEAPEDADDPDELTVKLDLARVYLEMGENEMASPLLQEVCDQGDDEQRRDANELLAHL